MEQHIDSRSRDGRAMSSMTQPAIVFLVRSLDMGGAERQLVELARGLHRAGWRVEVITFYAGGPLEPLLKADGVPLFFLHKRGRWDILCLWNLARFLRRSHPDIVHGYLPLPNVLLVLLRPTGRTRVIWGIRASNMDLERYDWLARVEFWLGTMLSRFADLIICNSNAGRVYHVARGYPHATSVVVPNGISLDDFRPDASARAELRREWGIRHDEHLVGLVARLDPMKDHSNFLRAAAQVLASRSDVRFVCVGEGPSEYRRRLEILTTSLGLRGRVCWVNARPDVWRVYNALDVAVLSSAFGEGFPNVVAEAMATGVPCVVTDVGDAAAVVADQGWVCPPSDSAALARAIGAALKALPCDGQAIRARIASQYSSQALFERTTTRLLALLESTFEAKRFHGRGSAVRRDI
jgi:glycosyltransferase involved in cell wall biosynthesis